MLLYLWNKGSMTKIINFLTTNFDGSISSTFFFVFNINEIYFIMQKCFNNIQIKSLFYSIVN